MMTTQTAKRVRKNKSKISNNKIVMVYRKSTDTDSLQQNSIEMQRSAATMFAIQNNLEIVASFEEHQSGMLPLSQANGILEALSACQSLGAAYLGFDRQDRASRNLGRWFQLKAMAAEIGVKIVIVKEGMPTEENNEISEIKEFLNGFVAQQTVKVMRSRIKEALALKKNQNKRYSNNAPFGYSWTEEGSIIVNEQEQAVIQKVKTLAETGLSTVKISQNLWNMGHTNRKGGKLTPMFVWRILNESKAGC